MALKVDGTSPFPLDNSAIGAMTKLTDSNVPASSAPPTDTPVADVADLTTRSGSHGPLDDPMSKVFVQSQLRADVKTAGGPSGTTAVKAQLHQKRLDDLARLPGEAHAAWSKLNNADRAAVLQKMEANYGKTFKDQFLQAATRGKAQVETSTYSNSPNSKFPMITDEQLKARGYHKAGAEHTGNAAWNIEVWVHPSGKTIRRDISTYQFGSANNGKPPAGTTGATKTNGPEEIDDPGDEQDPQDKAVELLGDAQQGLQQAQELMARKPVPWDDVNAAMMRSWQAQTELDQLMGDDPENPNPDAPDMSKVYPTFQQERTSVADLYQKLYKETERLNPPDPEQVTPEP